MILFSFTTHAYLWCYNLSSGSCGWTRCSNLNTLCGRWKYIDILYIPCISSFFMFVSSRCQVLLYWLSMQESCSWLSLEFDSKYLPLSPTFLKLRLKHTAPRLCGRNVTGQSGKLWKLSRSLISSVPFHTRDCQPAAGSHLPLTISLPEPVKFSGWMMHGHACKQYIFRSYSTSTFSAMRFYENSFTCQSEKDGKRLKGFKCRIL